MVIAALLLGFLAALTNPLANPLHDGLDIGCSDIGITDFKIRLICRIQLIGVLSHLDFIVA